MATEQRRRTDLLDPVPPPSGDRGHLAALLMVTALGVGMGMLAAPQTGADTRRALRKRLAAMGEDLGEDLEDIEARSRPLRRAVRKQAEDLGRRGRKKYKRALAELESLREEDNGGSAVLATALTVGAGLAAAYFLTSDRAAPARERVREVAATFRDEAESRWDNFQRRRGNGHQPSESGIRIDPADSAPQAG
jgi:hypothetical protein